VSSSSFERAVGCCPRFSDVNVPFCRLVSGIVVVTVIVQLGIHAVSFLEGFIAGGMGRDLSLRINCQFVTAIAARIACLSARTNFCTITREHKQGSNLKRREQRQFSSYCPTACPPTSFPYSPPRLLQPHGIEPSTEKPGHAGPAPLPATVAARRRWHWQCHRERALLPSSARGLFD